MCSINNNTTVLDIEDIKKTHKFNNYSEELWNKLIEEFKENYLDFKIRKDIILFQKKLQKKYKISLSNCELIKMYNELNINDINLKNLITKKTKIRFGSTSYNRINICTSRIYR